MADEELYAALRNADAAGDVEGAKKIASYIQSRAAPAQNDLLDKVGMAAGSVAEGVMALPELALNAGKAALNMGSSLIEKIPGVPPQKRYTAESPTADFIRQMGGAQPANRSERLTQDIIRSAAAGAAVLNPSTLGMLAGAAGGGAAGYTREVGGGPLAQIGAGLAGALAVPATAGALAPVLNAAKNVIEPWVPAIGKSLSGQQSIMGRTANTAAGAAKGDIIPLLKDQKQIVPNSIPTAGEAAASAGSPEFSALQMKADKLNPYAANERAQTQAVARNNSLGTFAGTPESLDAAVANRTANANVNYGDAFQQAIKVDPQLAQIASNPYFEKALPTALDLAKAAKIDPKTNVTQFLHFIKVGIDKQVSKTGEGALASMEKGAAQDLKAQLLDWLKTKNSPYENARQSFIADSAPINKMQVGQYLQDKLNAPVTDLGTEAPQRAASYAQALRDAPTTIRNSGGRIVADTLPQAIGPQNAQTATNVGLDLARRAEMERLARLGAPALEGQLNVLPSKIPGAPLNMAKSLANWALTGLSNKASDKSLAALGELMRNDPNELARLMEMAKPAQKANFLKILMSTGQAVPASMVGYENQ